MNEITRCPHCATRMVPTAGGRCPACGADVASPKPAPLPPPPPPRRHPLLWAIALLLMISGFWRFYHRPVQTLELVIVDLALIWLGAIGVISLLIKRTIEKQRRRRS